MIQQVIGSRMLLSSMMTSISAGDGHAFGAVAVQGAARFDEGLLCPVFGLLPLAHYAIDVVEDGRAVAALHFAVRVFVTLARPRHDVLVGCIGEIGKLAHTRDCGGLGRFGFSHGSGERVSPTSWRVRRGG